MIGSASLVLAVVVWVVLIHLYDRIYQRRGRLDGDDLITFIPSLAPVGGVALYWMAYSHSPNFWAASLLSTIVWTIILALSAFIAWLVSACIFYISYDRTE